MIALIHHRDVLIIYWDLMKLVRSFLKIKILRNLKRFLIIDNDFCHFCRSCMLQKLQRMI